MRVGTTLAVLAAIAFGVTTPFVQRLTGGARPLTSAALLYLGAALASVGLPRSKPASGGGSEAPVRARHGLRLIAVGAIGAAVAPALLVWGLGRISGATASLLLNLEAVFTVVLARALYAEPIGRRVAVAIALMFAGGAILALRSESVAGTAWGALAVSFAAFAWALDNTLTRPLSSLDPRAVVRWKALIGASLAFGVGRAFGEGMPTAMGALGLLLCGATGYGVSLRLYLRAQRSLGAARTGSIFALGPFVGAIVAIGLGDHADLGRWAVAAVLFVVAVFLHATERHAHVHRHEPLLHDHAHRHDDGHHDHVHDHVHDDGAPAGEAHSHEHAHDVRVHSHPHAPDVHHGHRH